MFLLFGLGLWLFSCLDVGFDLLSHWLVGFVIYLLGLLFVSLWVRCVGSLVVG